MRQRKERISNKPCVTPRRIKIDLARGVDGHWSLYRWSIGKIIGSKRSEQGPGWKCQWTLRPMTSQEQNLFFLCHA
ncbi:hypothetical protein CEXT_654341 [Caerostris extrusa]|uniref:Uncharacterized protein n=1 Tax=Caerostris extrusa TaxID=172846 RepID=A0AAV4NG17_CAEEX|nr:hypothetical protein CEXT_654341 [Caerostris extrusa]